MTFIAVLYGLCLMQFPPRDARHQEAPASSSDLPAGFAYLQREKPLRLLVIMALVPMVLGQPYQTMLTVFAKDVFESGGQGLGHHAVGRRRWRSHRRDDGRLVSDSRDFSLKMLLGLVGFGVGLVVFCFMPSMWWPGARVYAAGLSMQTYQVSNNTLLQMNVDLSIAGAC